MAEYSRAIPPGGEGTITLKLDPKSCDGNIEKSILVTCNDPRKPYFVLFLKGQTPS